MKVKSLSILLLFVIRLSSFSQETIENGNVVANNSSEIDFHIDQQLEIYKYMPSTLAYWQYGDWSTIEFKGTQEDGDFKTVDDFTSSRKFAFNTQSILSIPDKKLSFYGKFSYSSAEYTEADWNLFFKKEDTGTPFRFITERTGDWRTKHYGVTGYISKELSPKFKLGTGVEYLSNMYFRTLDTRNEQFNLNIKLHLSSTYQLNDRQALSFGVVYRRKKSEPDLSNEFKVLDNTYTPYVNIGLGDFEAQENALTIYITDNNPEFKIGFYAKDKRTFTSTYSYYPGREKWKQNIISLNSNASSNMYKYDYSLHNLKISYLNSTNNKDLLYKLNSRFVSGEGYWHNVVFQQTYIYDGLSSSLDVDLLRKNRRFFGRTSGSITMERISKKDMRYAQHMKYANINYHVKTDAQILNQIKNKINISFSGTYKMNISYSHDIASASSKKYTINIAHNEMAYHTADYYSAGSELVWFHKAQSTAIKISLQYKHMAPTNIRIKNDYSLLEKSTHKNNMSLAFNLMF